MHEPEFSLVNCGPVDRLQARVGLTRRDAPRLVRRALITAAVAWLPLLVFALVTPNRGADFSFFQDVAAHVRLLIVVPILIFAERSIGYRTRLVAADFVASGFVGEKTAPQFHDIVQRARKQADSVWAEVIVLALTYVLVGLALRQVTTDHALFWYELPNGTGLSMGGWWYGLVSSPIVTFLFLRWAWRYLVWSWFLRRLSRLELDLPGAHPDYVAGLGFINIGHIAFSIVSFAASCVVAAAAANRILYEGVSLKSYQSAIIGFLVVSIVLGLAPLLTFARSLVITKWRGILHYGRFASNYVRAFERKWVDPDAKPGEPMLGTADIQSLADLGSSFERLDRMRAFPIDRRTVIAFAAAAALPMLPLLLTEMPLREIVKLLLKAAI